MNARTWNSKFNNIPVNVRVKDFPCIGDDFTTWSYCHAWTNSKGISLLPVNALNSSVPFSNLEIIGV